MDRAHGLGATRLVTVAARLGSSAAWDAHQYADLTVDSFMHAMGGNEARPCVTVCVCVCVCDCVIVRVNV